jgi:hypothetical protein
MTTPKLKKLIRAASEIINLFLEKESANASSFEINPYYDQYEKDSEIVTITFDTYQLDWEFLEPVAKKLSLTQISWKVYRDDDKFRFSIYF